MCLKGERGHLIAKRKKKIPLCLIWLFTDGTNYIIFGYSFAEDGKGYS